MKFRIHLFRHYGADIFEEANGLQYNDELAAIITSSRYCSFVLKVIGVCPPETSCPVNCWKASRALPSAAAVSATMQNSFKLPNSSSKLLERNFLTRTSYRMRALSVQLFTPLFTDMAAGRCVAWFPGVRRCGGNRLLRLLLISLKLKVRFCVGISSFGYFAGSGASRSGKPNQHNPNPLPMGDGFDSSTVTEVPASVTGRSASTLLSQRRAKEKRCL